MASPHQSSFDNNASCRSCANWNNFWEMSPRRHSPNNSALRVDEMKQAEDMLSNELNNLSMQERSEAYDDVHCVGDELKETPELIQQSLSQFHQTVPKHRNAAYDIALKQNKAFVEDPSFRLKFLRAQVHNVDKAVRQMMQFLHYKGEFFGEDKIAREITLKDLTEEDMEVILSGSLHIQQGRDRMGRVIIYSSSKLAMFKPQSTFRAIYYMWYNVLVSRPEIQKKGLVEVYLGTPRLEGEVLKFSGGDYAKLMDAGSSIPFRKSAMHYSLLEVENRSLVLENAMLSLWVSLLPQHSRVRTRMHYGTVMELLYQLRRYGIPIDSFPLDMNGNIRKNFINVWYYEHLASKLPHLEMIGNERCGYPNVGSEVVASRPEAPYAKVASICTPSDNDVLSGRGRAFQAHPGNVRFRKFIQDHIGEYDTLDRDMRMEFNVRLTQVLIGNDVRFLKQTESGDWVALNAPEVRKKVSQQFRSLRKKK